VWKIRTGADWRNLRERHGPWQTLYQRFGRWSADGTWDRLLEHVQVHDDAVGQQDHQTERALGRSRGGLTTKIHLACDGRGLPLSFLITGGNINDRTRLIQSSKQSASPAARPGGHAFGRCTSSPTRAIPPTRSAPIYLAAGSLTPSPSQDPQNRP
jgi:transposase